MRSRRESEAGRAAGWGTAQAAIRKVARWSCGMLLLAMPLAAQIMPSVTKSSIVNSQHDFSIASTTAYHGTTDIGSTCFYCHTPHNANPGASLWNHKMGAATFSAYNSTTLAASVPALGPKDSSKLCLSCHDGVMAAGTTLNNGDVPFNVSSSYHIAASSPDNLVGAAGLGFSDDHPFAFAPNLKNHQITLPPSHDSVWLRDGKVQCNSCHEPHKEDIDPTQGKFLVKNNRASNLCVTCHNMDGWMASTHRQPTSTTNDAKYTSAQGAHTGYSGVANNGCESCHRPHTPQTPQRLVKFTEENVCYQCHGGSAAVSSYNLQEEFSGKTYRHPVNITPSVHDASESATSATYPLPETAVSTARHSECFDCHNGHATNATGATAPAVTGALNMVSGYTTGGSTVAQASNEYEVCFKCHADSANRPQVTDTSNIGIGFGRHAQRQYAQNNKNAYNLRYELNLATSFHGVVRSATIAAGSVPSLRLNMVEPDNATPLTGKPLSAASMMYCSDCHANSTGRNLGDGSTGPMGPHASQWPHLVERQNAIEPVPSTPGGSSSGLGSYAVSNFALCDKCHDLSGLLVTTPNASSFQYHRVHVVTNGVACNTCHNPHGSQSPRLVDFDTAIVAPYQGTLSYVSGGNGVATCTLVCHGSEHNARSHS